MWARVLENAAPIRIRHLPAAITGYRISAGFHVFQNISPRIRGCQKPPPTRNSRISKKQGHPKESHNPLGNSRLPP